MTQDSIRALTFLAGCALAAVGFARTDAASQAAQVPPDEAIRAILANRVGVERRHVGVVVGVIDPGGRRVVGHGGFSQGDPRRVGADTVFEIGSVTKVFTSLLLTDMERRGEIALDDPIASYLPTAVNVPARGGRVIQLQDLATHTSGLPRLPANLLITNPDNPYAAYTVENLYSFLSSHTLARDIGAQYEYSNLGVGLLGHVLALRARSDFETLVRERITAPLGMNATAAHLNPAMTTQLARGHNPRLEPAGNWDIPALAGAGALRSTANDLLQFLSAFIGTTKSDLAPAMARMLSVRRPAGGGLLAALGWHIVSRDGLEVIWHSGATGGYSAFVAYLPSRSTGVVVLANNSAATGSSVDDIGLHLLDSRNPLTRPVPTRARVTVAPAVLDGYAGSYEIAPGFVVAVTHEEGRLFVTPPGQPRHEIFAESARSFFATIADVQFSFDVDASGVAGTMTLHQAGKSMPGKRVAPAPVAAPRPVVAIEPSVLAGCVGRYELTSTFAIAITQEEARLFAQATGQGRFELFAEGDDRFFARVGGIEVSFDRDERGRATSLTIRQGGVARLLKRVE